MLIDISLWTYPRAFSSLPRWSKSHILEGKRFMDLFQIGALRHLEVYCHGAHRFLRGEPEPGDEHFEKAIEGVFSGLVDALEEGFKERGGNMKLDILYQPREFREPGRTGPPWTKSILIGQ
jgi:hypothetical protein